MHESEKWKWSLSSGSSNLCQISCSLVSKESACNAGDPVSIPGSGRSPGEGNGNPLHYSCLGNPMDRGAWWATVHGVARVRHDWETKPLNHQTTTNFCQQKQGSFFLAHQNSGSPEVSGKTEDFQPSAIWSTSAFNTSRWSPNIVKYRQATLTELWIPVYLSCFIICCIVLFLWCFDIWDLANLGRDCPLHAHHPELANF